MKKYEHIGCCSIDAKGNEVYCPYSDSCDCEKAFMYERGKADERKRIMEIVDSVDNIAQAVYLLNQYILEEELKND